MSRTAGSRTEHSGYVHRDRWILVYLFASWLFDFSDRYRQTGVVSWSEERWWTTAPGGDHRTPNMAVPEINYVND
jgi:hypothetical protein